MDGGFNRLVNVLITSATGRRDSRKGGTVGVTATRKRRGKRRRRTHGASLASVNAFAASFTLASSFFFASTNFGSFGSAFRFPIKPRNPSSSSVLSLCFLISSSFFGPASEPRTT